MNVYADNAATTQMSERAKKVFTDTMTNTWGNPSSLHDVGQQAKGVLEDSRNKIAALIGAEPQEIYFTSGGSEADNQAVVSAAMAGAKKGKKHLISTRFEHHALLHTLEKLEKQGFEVTLLEVHEGGIVTLEDVKKAVRPDTALVSVMAANNELGTIMPIREIGAFCKSEGILFHTDAVQAIGHIPLNVKDDNLDLLSFSAHKFHGPKGVGVLYAKKGIPLVNVIEGGEQERGKRAGTENVPAIAATAEALSEALENLEKNAAYVTPLREKLIEGLSKIPHSRLNGDRRARVPGTVNFCFEGIEGESMLLLLNEEGIEGSSGSACTSGSLEPSHVLLSLGLPPEIAHGSLRLSIGEYNTPEEIDKTLEVVPRVVAYLRSISPMWEALESGAMPHLI